MNDTLSLVPSEGTSSEFPVLKAFQEYIDAEQAKARKRMLGLSIFFIVLLVIIVVTFVLILTTVVNRNQALSDRLLDYALKEKEKTSQVVQQTPVASQPSVNEVLKPFFDRMEREQAATKAMYEQQQKELAARYEQQRKEYEARQKERDKANEEELRKTKAALEKERLRIKRENDRQAEIERQRRRLYPDYYKIPSESESIPSPPPPFTPALQPARTESVPKTAVQQSASRTETKRKSPLSDIKPITYFNVDDDDGVPFLLETPQEKHQK